MTAAKAFSWIHFFEEAGIPESHTASYADVFQDNRIQKDMLPELNKEILQDLGVSLMGDIIAILRYAKTVHERNSKSTRTQQLVAASVAKVQLGDIQETKNESADRKRKAQDEGESTPQKIVTAPIPAPVVSKPAPITAVPATKLTPVQPSSKSANPAIAKTTSATVFARMVNVPSEAPPASITSKLPPSANPNLSSEAVRPSPQKASPLTSPATAANVTRSEITKPKVTKGRGTFSDPLSLAPTDNVESAKTRAVTTKSVFDRVTTPNPTSASPQNGSIQRAKSIKDRMGPGGRAM